MGTKRKALLLTGATGFVGREIQQRILTDDEYDLTVAVRRPVDVSVSVRAIQIANITGDTDWNDALKGVDVVIHSAARAHVLVESIADPLIEFRKTNVDGALALARQSLVAGVKRFIFISSIGVNGANTAAQPFREHDVPAPHAPYAVSKLEAEIALQELCSGSTMELVIIRPPLVYASNAPGNFGRLLKLVALALPLPFALAKNRRSMIALENLVDFVLCCTVHPNAGNQTFLVSDDESISTPEMLLYLSRGMGKRLVLLPVPLVLMRFAAKLLGREALFNQLCGSLDIDSSKARSLLGWTPLVTAQDAMHKTAAAYLAEKP
ncbi:NAD-dependent epimerase/dehydratase family protein [Zhongshania aliphaticivorans]|uniref:NAD-dependent epimerase/dehydratase family protein n=1 Tax=Zhongshania aliphaticivorans TaxID=1470434 RepID=UPI0039C9AED6